MLSKPILISACVFSLLFGLSVRGVNNPKVTKSPVKAETGNIGSAPVQVTDNQTDVRPTPQVQMRNTGSSQVPASLIGEWIHKNKSDVNPDDEYRIYPSGKLTRVFTKAHETSGVHQTCGLIDNIEVHALFTVSESNISMMYKNVTKELQSTCGMAPGAVHVEHLTYSGSLNYSMALQNNGQTLILTPGNGNNIDNSVKTYQKTSTQLVE